MCCHEEGVCETNTTLQVYLLKLASINMNWKKAYILYVFIFRVHLSQPLRFVFVGVCTAHTLVLKTFPPGTGLSLWMLQLQRFNALLSWKVSSFLQAFFFFSWNPYYIVKAVYLGSTPASKRVALMVPSGDWWGRSWIIITELLKQLSSSVVVTQCRAE